jgi:hypothetical protein
LTKLTGKAPESSDIGTLNKSLQAIVSSIERLQTEPGLTASARHAQNVASLQFSALQMSPAPNLSLVKDEVCTYALQCVLFNSMTSLKKKSTNGSVFGYSIFANFPSCPGHSSLVLTK